MEFDMRALPMGVRYKLLNSTITPRPIAWVTTVSAAGVVNAAPYSFFNAVGADPALLVLGLLKHPETKDLKNTASNIMANGDFVVNLVCEDDAEKMNICSIDAPADVSEVDYAGLSTSPSTVVAPPRIATSPVSFECRKAASMEIGVGQTIIVGEILVTHVKDEFISDREKVYLDTPAMKLIGRTHGRGWYVRNSDCFQMDRPVYEPGRVTGDT